MLFGAHVSVADGYIPALDYAESVGCECMQIFAKSPRQWHGPPIDETAAQRFVEERGRRGFGPVFTHTAYLINLATPDDEMRERSTVALADEIVRAVALGASGVVTHVGTDPLGDSTAAARRVSAAVDAAFDMAGPPGGRTRLLLENTAGAGTSFGDSVEQLAACLGSSTLPSEQLGLCIDTCHAFASGWPVDSANGWDTVLSSVVSACGLHRIGLIHANDCLGERGTHRDRHAWIGRGTIGIEGFRAMVARPELADVAVCTEMPGQRPEKDVVNLDVLKALRESS